MRNEIVCMYNLKWQRLTNTGSVSKMNINLQLKFYQNQSVSKIVQTQEPYNVFQIFRCRLDSTWSMRDIPTFKWKHSLHIVSHLSQSFVLWQPCLQKKQCTLRRLVQSNSHLQSQLWKQLTKLIIVVQWNWFDVLWCSMARSVSNAWNCVQSEQDSSELQSNKNSTCNTFRNISVTVVIRFVSYHRKCDCVGQQFSFVETKL